MTTNYQKKYAQQQQDVQDNAAGCLEVLGDEGYEITVMDGEHVWAHFDDDGPGDKVTLWTEMIDGRLMLCIGDEHGEDARYVPAIVAHALTVSSEPSP